MTSIGQLFDRRLEDACAVHFDRIVLGATIGAVSGPPPAYGGKPTIDRVMAKMKSRGHTVFDGTRGIDLNIVGIRSASRKSGQFDDWITAFWNSGSGWTFHAWPATTDPGAKYMTSPLKAVRRKGTAILKAGQYRSAYKIGKHRGKYTALVQVGRVTVYRDNNRDLTLDMGDEEAGHFGINIHRAHWRDVLQEIGGHSAGCQVFQDPRDFAEFMGIVRKSARTYGDRFTYTLLED